LFLVVPKNSSAPNPNNSNKYMLCAVKLISESHASMIMKIANPGIAEKNNNPSDIGLLKKNPKNCSVMMNTTATKKPDKNIKRITKGRSDE
jgi:hypothetical protein